MTTYPGVRRATVLYFATSIDATVSLLIVMGLCCTPTLSYFYVVSEVPASYALFAFLGLCVYLGQRDLGDDLRTVTDASDSSPIVGVLGILTVVYYNVVIFVAALLATSLSSTGFGDWALAVALLYPFYDAEMARHPIPASVAGILASALVSIARFAETLPAMFGFDADGGTIGRF